MIGKKCHPCDRVGPNVNGGQRWNNGAAQVTDTGIFRLIGLPLRIVNSHEYCMLEEMVRMDDGGIVEIYTHSFLSGILLQTGSLKGSNNFFKFG